ncbi:MAG: DNA-binding YbaB/EbfC family protein [Planctomycetota bacterium]|jgi:DNA-binding YbaB/EbfC family protein
MSGSSGEMGNLLAQAQKMQRAFDEAQSELSELEVCGTAGGGVVQVTLNGQGEASSITITQEAYGAGREAMEELVLAALRDGVIKANLVRKERMSKVTGGLDLPGMM